MHIVYIEFCKSKSKNYKNACSYAKQIPNCITENERTVCWVDTIKEYIICQIAISSLISIVEGWKSSIIYLYGNLMSCLTDYYTFLETLKSNAGKYKVMLLPKDSLNVSLGAITYEDLPKPIVYYPEHYGAFFAFSDDIGEKIYFCECERKAIENYIKLRKQMPLENYTGSKTYPLGSDYFPEEVSRISIDYRENPLDVFGFEEKLCFRCNSKVPQMKYCHPMYGGKFKQKFGWYIKQEYFRLGIDPHLIAYRRNILISECTPEVLDAINRIEKIVIDNKYEELNEQQLSLQKQLSDVIENSVRDQLGYPKIGESWISETMLFHIVEELYPNVEIIRHHRPAWLEGLELDIYIPSEKIGFEYQGLQHFKAVNHWGGEEQLKKQQEHDIRKKRICDGLGICLICINYDEELSSEYIQQRIISAQFD